VAFIHMLQLQPNMFYHHFPAILVLEASLFDFDFLYSCDMELTNFLDG
jgi:hypothetical protein